MVRDDNKWIMMIHVGIDTIQQRSADLCTVSCSYSVVDDLCNVCMNTSLIGYTKVELFHTRSRCKLFH